MGCSSSSAQTVDQEKKPGTKPEESNGDTAAVRNGIIAEDVKTIEDQMQLPVQTALPDDFQTGTEAETEAVLMAVEAQEDLGSGEDLLAVSEPQPESAVCEDPAPEAAVSALAEDSAEPDAAVAVVEAVLPVENKALEEAPLGVEVLVETTEEASTVETVKTEAPDVAEEVVEAVLSEPEVTPVLEVAPESPAEAAVEVRAEVASDTSTEILDEATSEAASVAPAEAAASAKSETATENSAPETVSETQVGVSENTPSDVSETNKAAAAAEPSVPVDAAEHVINADIAAATIPEMTPLSPVTSAAQPATEVTTQAPPENAPPAEAPLSTEVTPAAEPALNAETSAPASVSETPTEVSTAEPPVEESTLAQSEASSTPTPAADPAPDGKKRLLHGASVEYWSVASANETSQNTESEKSKKED